MFAKIRWVCKVQSLGKHKNGWVKKKFSLGSGETKFPLGRGKKSTGSGSTGSVTEGCMYRLRILYFGEKRVVLKESSSRSRFWSKLAGITREMEGENTMEKHLKVFRA